MVYLGADHAGFNLKEKVKLLLQDFGETFQDLGAKDLIAEDDYPDYAQAVAQKVATDPQAKGILFCGSGQGICIAANKFRGVRAAQVWTPKLAQEGRNDDDINILCLAANYQSTDQVKPIIENFLKTPFEAVAKRLRRLNKISKMEA